MHWGGKIDCEQTYRASCAARQTTMPQITAFPTVSTRYGRPDVTMRTLPQRQPPVDRSMLRLLWSQTIGMVTTNNTTIVIAHCERGGIVLP